MDPKSPVEWDDLAALRPEPNCKAVFSAHRDELSTVDTLEAAVNHLYEELHIEYNDDERVPDQGAAFIFAYLVEQADLASFADGSSSNGTFTPLSLADRKPNADRLRHLFWEQEMVPWWIAVRFGVHYSLAIYCMWEANIPLMRRNVPADTLAQIDTAEKSE